MDIFYIIFYFVGFAFSIGAFSKLWDYDLENPDDGVGMVFMCIIWPIIWLFYLPYKLAKWLFK